METNEGTDDGFTILEVLAAFMILAISVAVTSQTVARSVRSTARAAERERVLSVVDDLRTRGLAQLKGGARLHGSTSGLAWTAEAIDARQPGIAAIVVTTAEPASRSYRFLVAGASSLAEAEAP